MPAAESSERSHEVDWLGSSNTRRASSSLLARSLFPRAFITFDEVQILPEKCLAPLLVIGYGNTLRSDDGVGPRVAEAVEVLELAHVRTLECGLLTPELADPISRAGTVIFVDAALDAPREVTWRSLIPSESSQIMTHAADPRTLLALARDVFGHVPDAWWLTIPVLNLGIGDALSPVAEEGFRVAVGLIRQVAEGCSVR